MTDRTSYVNHRYGKFDVNGGGKMKSKYKDKECEVSTKKAIRDKLRYVETRFCGECNQLFSEDGQNVSNYESAWRILEQEALSMARSNKGGRSKNTCFIYDTTINTGDSSLLSADDLHIMAKEYIERLRSEGYRVSKPIYTIHTNGTHHHLHIVYALHKTIQKKTNGPMRTYIRGIAERQKERHIQKVHEQ